jgi:general secretion pathway protein J
MTAGLPRAGSEAGFTLVEMLVALALFALVGLASFALLDAVIRTRDRTEGRLEAVAMLDRALILFGRDLAQSDPGSHRIADGVLTLGMGAAGGPSELSYALVDDTLTRRANDQGAAVEQPLVAGIAGLAWRGLDRAGDWHDVWPPEAESDTLAAIEMRLTLAEEAPSTVRRLVELPIGLDR